VLKHFVKVFIGYQSFYGVEAFGFFFFWGSYEVRVVAAIDEVYPGCFLVVNQIVCLLNLQISWLCAVKREAGAEKK
jgi:hypothetical protein